MYPFILATQILTLIIAFVVIIVLMVRKSFRGQVCFIALSFCVAIQAFGYFLELQSTSLDGVLMAIKVQYFGSCFVNLLSYYFILDYCNYKKNKGFISFLFAFNVVILCAVCTCDHHNLYYSSMAFVQDGLFPHIVLTHGPFYTAFKLEILIMNLVVFFTLMHHLHRTPKKSRKNESKFVFACMFPVFTCILYSINVFRVYDPSSASFVISGALILFAIYRHELFDVIHTARDSVIEAMGESLIVVDSSYQLLDHNPAADHLFPELQSSSLNTSLSSISFFLDDLFHYRTYLDFERENHYYRGQITKIYDHNLIVGFFALFFDITENRINMKNQIQLREQAEKANKAKSTILANMSHEIRTPLNAILGLTDILLNQNISYSVRNDIINIKNAGSTLLNIINDVLDLSKIESGKMTIMEKEYKLSSIMQDVLGIINVKLSQKPITLRVETSAKLPKYYLGDELRIRQLLINLLTNAVKFTDHGSISLIINAEQIPDNEDMITLIIKVKDTGRGISIEDQERIFETFEQADVTNTRSVEGSGLGLAICRRILELMNGTISVESQLNIGSTFTITLPQKISHNEHPISSSRILPNPLHENSLIRSVHCTALVVDDNPLNLEVAKGLLELFDIDVTIADSGAIALAIMQNQKFDVVFLDHMMPVMDGVETLHNIRNLKKFNCTTIPVIALTANAIQGTKERFLQAGFSDYISKPISLKSLSEILNKWITHFEDQNKLLN